MHPYIYRSKPIVSHSHTSSIIQYLNFRKTSPLNCTVETIMLCSLRSRLKLNPYTPGFQTHMSMTIKKFKWQAIRKSFTNSYYEFSIVSNRFCPRKTKFHYFEANFAQQTKIHRVLKQNIKTHSVNSLEKICDHIRVFFYTFNESAKSYFRKCKNHHMYYSI